MFFEPWPEEEGTPSSALRSLPQWAAPPAAETGVLLPGRIVARSARVVVGLLTVRAFRTGCSLGMETAIRQDRLPSDTMWDLRMSGYRHGTYSGGPLPDRMLRVGVRFADGRKATTLDQRPSSGDPDGPLLTWSLAHGTGKPLLRRRLVTTRLGDAE